MVMGRICAVFSRARTLNSHNLCVNDESDNLVDKESFTCALRKKIRRYPGEGEDNLWLA